MTCDELELLLPEGAGEPAARAHLDGCASCRQTLSVLSAAAQPALTATEKAKLVGLSSAVQSQWVRLQHRRSRAQSFLGLAIAASLGAVLASALMWKLNDARPPPVVQRQSDPEVLVLLEDSNPLTAEDESSFEVSWPSLTDEGDVL